MEKSGNLFRREVITMSENKTEYGYKQHQPVVPQYNKVPKGPRQTRHYEEYQQAERQRQMQMEQQRQQQIQQQKVYKNQMLAQQQRQRQQQSVQRKKQVQPEQPAQRTNRMQAQQPMQQRAVTTPKKQAQRTNRAQAQQPMQQRAAAVQKNQPQQPRQQIRRQPEQKKQQPQKQTPSKRQMDIKKRRRKKEILLCVLFVLILAVTFGLAKLYTIWKGFEAKAENSDFVAAAKPPQEITDDMLNVLILGTDKEGFRADVNMLVSFNVSKEEVHIISVPRDTRVTMTQDMIAHLKENNRHIPERNGVYGQCKLTELHAYAGDGNRSTFSVAMVEELLGVDIDYYVKVNLDAFQEIVDAVGGVKFDVEQRLYYTDPEQGLYIDLYPGEQVLDGKKAEMLVRFREGYAQKDLKRVQVQQAFIKALAEQIFASGDIINNLNRLIPIVLEKTETDMPVAVALQYVPYVAKINPAQITTDTVPGDGGSYFDLDEDNTKALVDYRIYGKEMPAYMQQTDATTQNDTTMNG